jgi:hypothetical protein
MLAPADTRNPNLFFTPSPDQAADAVHDGENYEVRRLLRMPRYFDDDFELAALRCFRCGGGGHREAVGAVQFESSCDP